jgi:glycosyltransferase involved in cell wall biosynthesis
MFLRLGVNRERLRLILPFALPSQPPPVEIPSHIADFIAQHSPILLAVCLLTPEYDIALQIDVMATLLETYPRAGLLIIGAGVLEPDLRSQIDSKPYATSILLCGNVPRPITMNIMLQADILVRTTWYDGDAVSVREALHFDLPVVASDNGMRPEGVHLFPPRDPEAYLRTTLTVLASPRPARVPKPARDENLAAVLDLYRELV